MSLSSFCLTSLFSFNKHVGSLVSTFPASLVTTSLLTHWVSITIRLSPPAFCWSCCCQSQPSWWLNAATPNSQIEFLTLLYFLLYSTLLITPFSWNPFLTHLSGQSPLLVLTTISLDRLFQSPSLFLFSLNSRFWSARNLKFLFFLTSFC